MVVAVCLPGRHGERRVNYHESKVVNEGGKKTVNAKNNWQLSGNMQSITEN